MPPRADTWPHAVVRDKDGVPPPCNYPQLVSSMNRMLRGIHPNGRLRFACHGWSGITSTALTSAAIVKRSSAGLSSDSCYGWEISALTLLAAATAAVAASSGMPLVSQAPVRTVIARNVVPPHRHAFRRTASSVYYLSCRIAWSHMRWICYSKYDGRATLDWAWGCFALLYAMRYFLPIHEMEWHNGNTYVFVLPMAAGIIADALFQLPWLQCQMIDADPDGIVRDYCWNENVVNETDLLCVLLSALIVAFVFTLAFRGMLGIKTCYWGSAAVVHAICCYLIFKALPFVAAAIH